MTNLQLLQKRAQFLKWVRHFFDQKDFIEVDTPILVPCPGAEIHMEYFETTWTDVMSQKHPVWLRSSPELHLKKALATGAERVYEVAKCFRNHGELSKLHQPEFTMLEWYQTQITDRDMIDFTERFLHECARTFQASFAPLTHFSVTEAFAEFAKITLEDQDPGLAQQAQAAGVISVQDDDDFETAYFKTLIEKIEPRLRDLGTVVLYDYPPSQAALAHVENGVAKRFEFYINGVELCNGYQELTDADENQKRFDDIHSQRRILGKRPIATDPGFIDALRQGIPTCCGNALGLDRLLSLLCGTQHLDSAIAFRRQAPFSRIWDDA